MFFYHLWSYQFIRSYQRKLDQGLYEAADDLGANPKFETFLKSHSIYLFTGILSGMTMVLLPAATTPVNSLNI